MRTTLVCVLLLFATSAARGEEDGAWEPTPPASFQPGLPADTEAEAALDEALGGGFAFLRTDHFSIAHRGDELGARYQGEILESTYAAFTLFLDGLGVRLKPADALVAVALRPRQAAEAGGRLRRSEAELAALRSEIEALPAGSKVRLKQPNGGIALYSKGAALREIETASKERAVPGRSRQRDGQDRIEAVIHEAVHRLCAELGLASDTDCRSTWFGEGLAALLEPSRHGYLLPTPAVHPTRLDRWQRARAAGDGIGLERLLTDDELFAGDDRSSPASDEAWSLTHFLVTTRLQAFAAYLRAPKRGGRIVAFERSFGGSLAELEPLWDAHVAALY